MEFEEGGFKFSGIGRLGGLACLDFLEYKQITQDYAPLEEARRKETSPATTILRAVVSIESCLLASL